MIQFRDETEAEWFCRSAYRAIHHEQYRAQTPEECGGDPPFTREENPWSSEAGGWVDELIEHGFTIIDATTFIFNADVAELRQMQREGIGSLNNQIRGRDARRVWEQFGRGIVTHDELVQRLIEIAATSERM